MELANKVNNLKENQNKNKRNHVYNARFSFSHRQEKENK